MTVERRNLYRILHVQPEAPAEVIKASYRALMSAARMHPDLGGDHAKAAALNDAYAVLSDPERRRAYDLARRKAAVQASAGTAAVQRPPAARAPAARSAPVAPAFDPCQWLARRQCPFCQAGLPAFPMHTPAPIARCACCDSPLAPAPSAAARRPELIGRRGHERFARDQIVTLRLPGEAQPRSARLRDLSVNGLAFMAELPVPKGLALRVTADHFDTVALVVGCRRAGTLHSVHAQLLTLHFERTAHGTVVSVRA
jgi:curved DNA-binding protein CbpA